MKTLKYLGIGFAAFIAVAVAAAAAVALFVDPNEFKPEIAQAVRDQTGREFALDGDLELTLFPWLGVRAGPARLADANGFAGGTFAEVRELDVKVRLAPLLGRRIEAETVTLQGLRLNLRRAADGRGNWDDLLGSRQHALAESKPSGRSTAPQSEFGIAALAIGGVRIVDAEISWEDRQAETQLAVHKLNLNTGPVSLTEPVSFESNLQLHSGSAGIEGTAALAGMAHWDLGAQRLEISDATLSTDLGGEALAAGMLSASLDFSSRLDLATQEAELDASALAFRLQGGPLADGRLEGQSSFSGRYDPGGQRLLLSEGALSLKLAGGPLGQGHAGSTLGFAAAVDLARQTVGFEQSRLGVDIAGGPLGDGRLAATLDFAAGLDLRNQHAAIRDGRLDLTAERGPLGDGSLVAGGDLSAQIDLRQQTVALPESALRMVLSGGPWGEGSVSARLQTRAWIDLAKRVAELADGRLRFDGKDGPMPGAQSGGFLEFNTMKLAFARPTVELGQGLLDIETSGGALGTGGKLQATLDFSARADFLQQVYALDRASLNGRLKGPGLPADGLPTALDLAGVLDLDDQSLDVARLEGSLLGVPLDASLAARGIIDDPEFAGRIRTRNFSPRVMMRVFGLPEPKTADSGVLRSASVDAAFQGRRSRLNLEGLKLSLDDSALAGALSLENAAQPTARFDLRIDQIDLDRYLPVAGDAEQPTAETSAGASGTAPRPVPLENGLGLPIKVLRGIDLEGRVKLGQLKFNNLRARKLVVKTSAKQGLVTIDPFRFKGYEGSGKGALSLDVRGEMPQLAARVNLSNVAIEPLLTDLSGEASLSGKGNVRMDLQAAGWNDRDLLRSLQGTAAASFRDGALKGINIAHTLRVAKARVRGRRPPEAVRNETDFAELSGSARINGGVLRNDDLYVKSPLLRITGKGDVDLPAETLDYLASATVVGTLEGQGGRDLRDLEGVTVPVRATGALDKPDYQIDVEAMVAAYVRSRAEREIEKAIGKHLPREPAKATGNTEETQERTTSVDSPEELGLKILKGLLRKQ